MEKINRLKKLFKKEKIDGYLIPKNDEFFDEYISQHNDRLNYISNFTGSYGFSLILRNKNYLFVDGRYTLQANKQSGKFFKVVTFPNKMPYNIFGKKKLFIGFDPKILTSKTLKNFFRETNFNFKPIDENLVDEIWIRKVKEKKHFFYFLPKNSVGNSYKFKIDKIVTFLKKEKADFQFITASENNAWLLNMRGKDSKYCPIPHCHVLIDKYKNVIIFCDLNKINSHLKKYFKKIKFFRTDFIPEILSEIKKKKFILDENTCSFYYEKIIAQNNRILKLSDPIYNFKAIKSEKEIKNIKKAHIYDGIALTKYLFWVKKNFSKKKITEISSSNKLFELRRKNKKFKSLSFPTISSSGPNGAIIHYKATSESNRVLKKGDIYLVDSGGQYEFGTTDVTRTISLKNSNQRIKNIFTRVLKGHIAVANFEIKKNTFGSKIDFEARKHLKQIGLNYSHGTGHGVGYFLNVHEGPQAISKNNFIKFEKGMVVSNEPGYYEKDSFGIRIENLIYVKKQNKKKYFENLTMVPIDKELIIKSMLNENEKIWLNDYHKKVYNNLKVHMNKSEIEDLKLACSAI